MRLHTFGKLTLEGSLLTRRKPLLLLAYLAVEGPKSRRHLAELFYMEASDPLNSLAKAFGQLRKGAPGSFGADATRAWACVPSDVADFLAADTARLEPLADLYRGAFAEDVSKLGAELEEWVLGTREYLAGRLRQALLQQAERDAGAGRLAQAARHAERAYTLPGAPEPEPDQFARIYALLLAGGSPRAAAVRSAAEDYGIALPSAVEVGASVASEKPRTPHNLPPAKTSFVGRERELSEIAEKLTDPECRLLTLHGMGGVGKSRLALQAAWAAVEAGGFAGVYFVPLDALPSPDLIPGTVAEQLGLRLEGPGDALAQLAAHIGTTPLLIILDNYEHLMSAATLPARLQEACPNLKLIVTSREVLRLEEEWVMPLDGLSYPARAASLADAEAYEAVSLFLQRAKRTRLDYRPADDDVSAILKICELTEGSPLALELAATWVRALPTGEIAKEVARSIEILESPSRNLEPRHRSIQGVLQQSWNLLTRLEREALMGLSIFKGGFTRHAASEVCGVTLATLSSLVSKAWLRVGSMGRYDRHMLMYSFAHEKLMAEQDAAERKELEQRFLEYYRSVVWGGAVTKIVTKSAEVYGYLDAEQSNLWWAVALAEARGDAESFTELLYGLSVTHAYYDARGCRPEVLEAILRAACQAEASKMLTAAHYLFTKAGNIHREQYHDLDGALAAYERALGLAQKSGDAHREIILLSLTGIVQYLRGEAEGPDRLQRARDLAEARGDLLGLSHALQNSSYVAYERADWDEMLSLCQAALDNLEQLEKLHESGYLPIETKRFFALMNLGEAYKHLGDTGQALKAIERAHALAQQADNQFWSAYAQEELGWLHHDMNRRMQAQTLLEAALTLYQDNRASKHAKDLHGLMCQHGYALPSEERRDHDNPSAT